MTQLQIRRLPFRFDESVPFQWNPANPEFGVLANGISVFAIAFERYIVAAMRQARRLIEDPDVLAEADAFTQQEALHAKAHRLHVDALAGRYPAVQAALDEAFAAFDELLEARPLKFHLGYIASLEATFTPTMKMMLDNRGILFSTGDARVASLFVWHFVEEIEHRSSALLIYDAVVGEPWYRLRNAWTVRAHVQRTFLGIMARFAHDVPLSDRGVEIAGKRPPFRGVPKRALATAALRVFLGQLPGHKPAKEPLPAFASAWFEAYERGEDMTTFEGTAATAAP